MEPLPLDASGNWCYIPDNVKAEALTL